MAQATRILMIVMVVSGLVLLWDGAAIAVPLPLVVVIVPSMATTAAHPATIIAVTAMTATVEAEVDGGEATAIDSGARQAITVVAQALHAAPWLPLLFRPELSGWIMTLPLALTISKVDRRALAPHAVGP